MAVATTNCAVGFSSPQSPSINRSAVLGPAVAMAATPENDPSVATALNAKLSLRNRRRFMRRVVTDNRVPGDGAGLLLDGCYKAAQRVAFSHALHRKYLVVHHDMNS